MDIAFLTTSLERGGAETQLVRIATTLRRRGWDVGILTMMPSAAFLDEVGAAGIPLAQCPDARARIPWRTALSMVRQLRRWRPTLMVTFNFPADAFGRVCGRIAFVPTIISAMGTTHIRSAARRCFYRFTEPLIARTVANSKAAARSMVAGRILTPAKTLVIPNGMLLEPFSGEPTRARMRAELGVGDREFLWVAVGNLRPAKDYPTLLEAVARCADAAPGFKVRVVGADFTGVLKTGPGIYGAEALRRQAAGLRLEEVATFLGARQDVPAILNAADGYVLSSAWEGLPNAVMEAMAAGLPVVATDVGDVRELVEDGVSGWVVPPGDPGRMAERMLALMALQSEARLAMGAQGAARIRARYENERVVDEWEALFRALATRSLPDPVKA